MKLSLTYAIRAALVVEALCALCFIVNGSYQNYGLWCEYPSDTWHGSILSAPASVWAVLLAFVLLNAGAVYVLNANRSNLEMRKKIYG